MSTYPEGTQGQSRGRHGRLSATGPRGLSTAHPQVPTQLVGQKGRHAAAAPASFRVGRPAGQVEKEGCWQALLGKVLNSTRSRLNICFPDFLQSPGQQKENIIYSDSKYEVTLHPFLSSAPASSTQSPKPITSTSQRLLEPATSHLLYHCSSFLSASSVHGLHGTVSMHRNLTYLFKKPLPCLGGFLIPHHL